MPRIITETPWQQFKQRWENCSLCKLHGTRRNIVLCRGKIPCDVGFCGEAPGTSEDDLGVPFVGPAGHLLDDQIAEAMENAEADLSLCFFNLVCCIPKEKGKKVNEPPKECIEACDPRLIEFVNLCKPRLLILVGDLAKKYIFGQAHFGECEWLQERFMEFAHIVHPASLLRMRENEPARFSLIYNKTVVILENAFREMG